MLCRVENIVERNIHGRYFLVNITQNYLNDTCNLYEINDIGHFIWDQLDGDNRVCDIARNLKDCLHDEVDYEILLNDVEEFIELLVTEGFAVK